MEDLAEEPCAEDDPDDPPPLDDFEEEDSPRDGDDEAFLDDLDDPDLKAVDDPAAAPDLSDLAISARLAIIRPCAGRRPGPEASQAGRSDGGRADNAIAARTAALPSPREPWRLGMRLCFVWRDFFHWDHAWSPLLNLRSCKLPADRFPMRRDARARGGRG